MRKMLFVACGSLSILGAVTNGWANTILTNSGIGSVSAVSANVNEGYDFTVGANAIQITALGLWDGPQFTPPATVSGSVGDGFASEHVVGLWDNSGNLLAKAVMQIGTGDTLMGEFRYAAVLIPTNPGPVILSAGSKYVLGAAYAQFDPDMIKVSTNASQPGYDPAVNSGDARFSAGVFGFPDTVFAPGAFIGPNALFTVLTNGHTIPESGATLAMMLLALVACLIGHRVVAQRA
jgi:hypothetical protein